MGQNSKLNNIKYLGVDWGEKRIGLALGDSETKIASPFKVVSNIDEIIKIVKDEDINVTVIGKPMPMSNVKCQMSKEFSDFINNFKKRIRIPVRMVDERLSTKAADKLAGNKKSKAPQDAIAAMIILQSYFDKHERSEYNKTQK